MIRPGLIVMLCTFAALSAHARGVYQEPKDFLREAFPGTPPAPQVLWLTHEIKGDVTAILGHTPDMLRIRYWKHGRRSVWVLNEIGKERPITVGIVIDQRRIERVKVLVFRESRGWEVRYPFFTDQFRQAALDERLQLDHDVDGISGATLSVRAVTKLARLALYLDRHVEKGR